MANPYRLLALGVLGAFGVGLASLAAPRRHQAPPPPPLLPAAHAKPAEVVLSATLRPGETLSQLLARMTLRAEEARALLEQLQAVQDPRRVRAGLKVDYRVSTRTGAARRVELQLDPDHTFRADGRTGRLVGRVEEVPVRADTVVLAGAVKSSLYRAMLAAEGGVPRAERERIVDLLADKIFAWKVDFSRELQRGDGFRVLYERMVRPDGSARAGRILAVQFEVGGRLQEAYLFAHAGAEDYYDRDGESLKRAFLRAPLEFRRISSAYSTGRFHPILRRVRAHHGIDYAASSGTPIRAVGDGLVRKAGWGGGYGNVVEIWHKRGYASRYAHLRGFAPGVRQGMRVRQGQVIGYVGSTGLSTGPHLHYEFHANGRPVNPSSVRFLSGDPVPAGARAAFRGVVEQRVAAMDRVGGPVFAAARDSAAPPSGRRG
ncbi:MAG TPA: peptidoglycan DD-metalloendopeptidase family protein [Longimicrobiaceae bacterium]|nr:peptidoglycan DD-metalloendopeptidase family protein [Longimicrobiaceae bacterium]